MSQSPQSMDFMEEHTMTNTPTTMPEVHDLFTLFDDGTRVPLPGGWVITLDDAGTRREDWTLRNHEVDELSGWWTTNYAIALRVLCDAAISEILELTNYCEAERIDQVRGAYRCGADKTFDAPEGLGETPTEAIAAAYKAMMREEGYA